jgi:flagellar hook-associated protein 2
MKSTSISSAYKVYNDKELDKQMEQYKDLIKKWQEKAADQEDYYYKKFSQMEVQLSKIQNQTNSLAGMLGNM